VHGPGIDEPLARESATGEVVYYHADGLGSITTVTDATGAVVWTRRYDAWGRLEEGREADGYAFTGREWEPAIGLYYYRARYYDPEAGRFISEDPIGLAGGVNGHSYSFENPATFADPSGLDAQLLVGGPYGGHPYGHLALRVFGAGYDKIYDFGRYGATWGTFGSEGEGILHIWDNFDAYIAGENATGRTTTGYTYKTTPDQDSAMIAYYAGLIGDRKPTLERAHMTQYRIRDYHAANFNCTTLSTAALAAALPDVALSITDPRYNNGRGVSWSERVALAAAQNGSRVVLPLDLQQGILAHGGYINVRVYSGAPKK
jgi:RHS repeat-associated protein